MGITKDSLSTVDGQSVNTMDKLSKLAKKMGSETAFSATECSQALNYLALAGYNTEEMCKTLPTVLNFAAAGDIDLASASDMVTDAIICRGEKHRQDYEDHLHADGRTFGISIAATAAISKIDLEVRTNGSNKERTSYC